MGSSLSKAPTFPKLAAAYFALMGLLLLSWGLSFSDLGHWNLIWALAIGVAKAAIVIGIFMEIASRAVITRIYAAVGLFWLAIMMVLTFGDYHWR